MTTPIRLQPVGLLAGRGPDDGARSARAMTAGADGAPGLGAPGAMRATGFEPAVRFEARGVVVKASIVDPRDGVARQVAVVLRPVPDDPERANARVLIEDMRNRTLVDWQGRMLRLEPPGLALPRDLPLELRSLSAREPGGAAAGQAELNPGRAVSSDPLAGPVALEPAPGQARRAMAVPPARLADPAAASRPATVDAAPIEGPASSFRPEAQPGQGRVMNAEPARLMNGGPGGGPGGLAIAPASGEAPLVQPASPPVSGASTHAVGSPGSLGQSLEAGDARVPPAPSATAVDTPATLLPTAGGSGSAGSLGESLRLAAALLSQSSGVRPGMPSPAAVGLSAREHEVRDAARDPASALGPSGAPRGISASAAVAGEPVMEAAFDATPAAGDPMGGAIAKTAGPAVLEARVADLAQPLGQPGAADRPWELPTAALAQHAQADRPGRDRGGDGAHRDADEEGDVEGRAILECELSHLGRLTVRLEWKHGVLFMRVDAESGLATHERAGLMDIFGSACEIAGAKGHLVLAVGPGAPAQGPALQSRTQATAAPR